MSVTTRTALLSVALFVAFISIYMNQGSRHVGDTQALKPASSVSKSKSEPKPNVSVWMLPAPSSREYEEFQEIIDNLAAKDDKHTFHPHVTLAVLNATTSPAQVEQVLEELKTEFFATRIEFEKLFPSKGTIMVQVRKEKDGGLVGLHRRFHEKMGVRLDEYHGTDENKVKKGGKDAKKKIKEWYPHMSLTYHSNLEDKLSYIKEMEDKEIYRSRSRNKGENENTRIESIELAGYDGFKVGALYAAHCSGDLNPEKWEVFLKIEDVKSI